MCNSSLQAEMLSSLVELATAFNRKFDTIYFAPYQDLFGKQMNDWTQQESDRRDSCSAQSRLAGASNKNQNINFL